MAKLNNNLEQVELEDLSCDTVNIIVGQAVFNPPKEDKIDKILILLKEKTLEIIIILTLLLLLAFLALLSKIMNLIEIAIF